MRAKKKRFAYHLLKGLKGDVDLTFDDEMVMEQITIGRSPENKKQIVNIFS